MIGEDDMNDIQTFMFKDFAVRAFEDNGEIYVVANDVCDVLGYTNPRSAIQNHVFTEDVAKFDTLSQGGVQGMNCVNESGLYALIFGSRKAAAKKFKRWVTSEVLPAIRKTGRYEMVQKDNRQLSVMHEFEEMFTGLMRKNVKYEHCVQLLEEELKVYRFLETELKFRNTNVRRVVNGWMAENNATYNKTVS